MMEGHCDTPENGDVADRHLQIIRYSPFQPWFRLSSLWFVLRVFYVRVSNFRVHDSTPEYLTLNHTPLEPDTILEVNGTRNNIYSDRVSLLLRRDRVDKKSEEATFVSTSVRLTGSVKFDVFDKKDLILCGALEIKKHNRKGMLEAIPEHESTECLKDMPPPPKSNMQSPKRSAVSGLLLFLEVLEGSCFSLKMVDLQEAGVQSPVNTKVTSSSYGSSVLSSVQHIPKQDVIKLTESTYLLWKHQLEENPVYVVHRQQDKLLASWLLTTVSMEVLPHITGLTSARTIWNAVSRLFEVRSSAKISSLRHSLHSQRKAGLTVSDYLAKIKTVCDLLNAAGCDVPEKEQVSVILTGLSMEFESIIAIAYHDVVSFDSLTEMLLDCEARQKTFLSDGQQGSQQGGYRGRGRGRFNNSNRPQCQLCGKFGHIVQRCYRRFDRDFTELPMKISLLSSGRNPPCMVCLMLGLVKDRLTPQIRYSATHHVSNDLGQFNSGMAYKGNNTLLMGNGEVIKINHVGQGFLSSNLRPLVLQNMLHAPH
ncbi:hypothetical protein F3Y22_tig00112649pilonHSYRG00099 [Hibiscus syriacus]|uniref:CCHC-type domain-containing protein n=1 Tax=Hibiscus syriacus TaxID=106335 RepID=A0A6A2XT49_HIBSY|nr:hypothetical protein F3Y22_tig00112649pilonHSYRG00099 [Hibiscus syriacus]